MHRAVQMGLVLVAAVVVIAQVLPATSSSFTDSTAAKGTVTAAPDWTGPTVSDLVIQKAEGGATDKVRPGGTFYVYAAATDSGNPASGVKSVTAAVSAVATTSSATLSPGSWTVGGKTYAYRSGLLTAKSYLWSSSYDISATATDVAGNAPTTRPGTVQLPTGSFTAADVLTVDRAGNTGLAQEGDQVAFVFNRAPEPASLVPGWDGSATTVKVLLVDGARYGLSSSTDLIAPVDEQGNMLGLGYVLLNGDYVTRYATVTFGTSAIVLDGAKVTITLDGQSGSARDDNNSRRPSWTPSADAYDEYGVSAEATPVSQTGSARRQF